ncbi:MAG TPA: universal stress protein [Amycolatopsis sp.]|nr:universal stress protein [Amycolatopsis sp.]
MADTTASHRRLFIPGDPPADTRRTHLVAGYERDGNGDEVLLAARDLAERLDAALHVVHTVCLSDYPVDPDSSDWEEQARHTLAEEHEAARRILAQCHTPWSYHAGHGDPVRLLRTVADECDALMFVVGSRGENVGAWVSRLVGHSSVSHGLIKRSHRLVTVVPTARHSLPAEGRR